MGRRPGRRAQTASCRLTCRARSATSEEYATTTRPIGKSRDSMWRAAGKYSRASEKYGPTGGEYGRASQKYGPTAGEYGRAEQK